MRTKRSMAATGLCAAVATYALVGSHLVAAQEPAAGKAGYEKLCASCHGTDGKGHGPAAASLEGELPDLTQLAKNNDGKFPTVRVMQSIDGTLHLAGHGTREMPVWGNKLEGGAISGTTGARKREYLEFIVGYVQTLQEK